MAGNVKISDLPSVATMTDSTIVPVVSSGNTQKIDGSSIKLYVNDGLANVAFTGEYSDLANVPDAAGISYTETSPADWGNASGNIDNVGEALDYLANAKADLATQVVALTEGTGFAIPGPFVNEAAALAAGVQVGEIYYDNGGTVRVVQG